MSYEKCKYISLDKKNNKIKVTIASNNVLPLDWYKCELCENEQAYSFDDKLLILYVNMQQGGIQISTINDNTINFVYALYKVREYHRANNIDSYEDLYKGCHRVWEKDENKSRLEVYKEVYGKSFEVFKKALEEKFEGKYKVVAYGWQNISKIGKYDRGYERFWYGGRPVLMNYKQAYIFVEDMSSESRKLEIVKVD